MICPECGKEIDAGSSPGNGEQAPEDAGAALTPAPDEDSRAEGRTEADEETGAEAVIAKAARPAGPGNVPWSIIIGGMALLVVSAVALVLAFVLLPWGGSNPEDTVERYFKAFEENRQGDVFGLYDPVDLEEVALMYGMDVEEFERTMAEENEKATAGSVRFEGLVYTVTVEEYAKVEITGGTASITDPDGQTSSEDMSGTVIKMVKRDGQWFLKMLSDEPAQQ